MLYLFWFIIWSPLIINEKVFWGNNIMNRVGNLILDFFVGSTYHGSWYLSALLLSLIILWTFHKVRIGLLILPLSLFLYVFLECWYLGNVYQYLQRMFRTELTMTFISGLTWAGMGYFLAIQLIERTYTRINNWLMLIAYIILYIVHVITQYDVINLISIPLLFILFHNWKLSPKPIFTLMRKTSTIIFLFHFIVVVVFKHLINNQMFLSGPLYLLMVFAISLVIALCIVRLSVRRYFDWLKYAY